MHRWLPVLLAGREAVLHAPQRRRTDSGVLRLPGARARTLSALSRLHAQVPGVGELIGGSEREDR